MALQDEYSDRAILTITEDSAVHYAGDDMDDPLILERLVRLYLDEPGVDFSNRMAWLSYRRQRHSRQRAATARNI